MNQNSEVIALKGAGLSAHQVLAPLILAGLAVSMISFAFNDRIVARASATLEQWKAVEYGPLPIARGDRTNVRGRDGDELSRVGPSRDRQSGVEGKGGSGRGGAGGRGMVKKKKK